MSHTEGKLIADGMCAVSDNLGLGSLVVDLSNSALPRKEVEAATLRLVACWNEHDEVVAKCHGLRKERDELLRALKNCIGPLMLYQAYGWNDRNGLINEAQAILSRYQEEE